MAEAVPLALDPAQSVPYKNSHYLNFTTKKIIYFPLFLTPNNEDMLLKIRETIDSVEISFCARTADRNSDADATSTDDACIEESILMAALKSCPSRPKKGSI